MTAPHADGPDLSHWNTLTGQLVDPYWQLCSHKATEGANGFDPMFAHRWLWMRDQQFKYRGAYHWLRSDSSMADQAANLVSRIGLAGGLEHGEFVQCDWEVTANIIPVTAARVAEWCDRVQQAFGRECVIVYSSDWVPGFATWRDLHADFPLWYANYSTGSRANGGWAECERYGADLWQWTSSFVHASVVGRFDMNHVFDWAVLDRITDQLPPPPQPLPDPNREEDVTAKLIINDPILNASFTHDGIPIAPEDIPAMVEQGWKQVARDHPWWRAAIMHRNGPEATRLYYGDR